jgi:hypothetical protein
VIVGVLDQGVDTQFVRINRTFLGPGDPLAYAQIKDSSEYNPSEVRAFLVKKRDGDVIDSIELQFIEKPSRDPGVFYNENVGFYYTDEPLFTEEESNLVNSETIGNNVDKMTYELRASIRGESYSAETGFPSVANNMISTPQAPVQGTPRKVDFYRIILGEGRYRTYNFNYTTRSNVFRYEGVIRTYFNYIDSQGNLFDNLFIDVNMGTQPNSANGDATFPLNTESWYNSFEEQIKELPDVQKVQIEVLEFRLTGINEELDNYIDVIQPISDFTPVLNTYSNLSNEAIGIVGSRGTATRIFWLSELSLEELDRRSQNDQSICFCVQDWSNSAWVCTGSVSDCP